MGPKTRAHLYRRATFGAAPTDIDKALSAGFSKTLDKLLVGESKGGEFTEEYRESAESVILEKGEPDPCVPGGCIGWSKPTSTPRKAHTLLAQSFRNQLCEDPLRRTDVRAELNDSQTRVGEIPPVLARYEQGHRHVDLARFQPQC